MPGASGSNEPERRWAVETIRLLKAEACRAGDTHLVPFPLPRDWGIDLYLKDESTHPTGSLKHRLARSLFMYALCNGLIHQRSTVVEASSGSTAVSEAYFARLIGLPFVAVVPSSTSAEKVDAIRQYGGQCRLVDGSAGIYEAAQQIADDAGGHYMDQFTYAERATDWLGTSNIADSIFSQLRGERYPEPAWVVAAAGTGGTCSATGRAFITCGKCLSSRPSRGSSSTAVRYSIGSDGMWAHRGNADPCRNTTHPRRPRTNTGH